MASGREAPLFLSSAFQLVINVSGALSGEEYTPEIGNFWPFKVTPDMKPRRFAHWAEGTERAGDQEKVLGPFFFQGCYENASDTVLGSAPAFCPEAFRIDHPDAGTFG